MTKYKKAIVTGGCGFIGRWVVGDLLARGYQVAVLDDLSNCDESNLDEFRANPNFIGLTVGSITDEARWEEIANEQFDICLHLAASINVQDSIDDPATTFDNDVIGTFLGLEYARKNNVRFVLMSTCMVYAPVGDKVAIDEEHPTLPVSPYAGSKLAAENMTLSYYYAYNLPTLVLRPFNTYGPFQRSDGEGGVVATFVGRKLAGQPLLIYGDGTQTRDLLYVSDCAKLVVDAGESDISGIVLNGGSGVETPIIELASVIAGGEVATELTEHIHPQSEIMRLKCDNTLASKLLGWQPQVSLKDGIAELERWLANK